MKVSQAKVQSNPLVDVPCVASICTRLSCRRSILWTEASKASILWVMVPMSWVSRVSISMMGTVAAAKSTTCGGEAGVQGLCLFWAKLLWCRGGGGGLKGSGAG